MHICIHLHLCLDHHSQNTASISLHACIESALPEPHTYFQRTCTVATSVSAALLASHSLNMPSEHVAAAQLVSLQTATPNMYDGGGSTKPCSSSSSSSEPWLLLALNPD
jgi:hypothetical protein